jgi:macrodomain Ter protein organizer (MatP/YcbG family)
MDGPEHADANVLEDKGRATRTRRKPGAKTPTDTSKRSLNLRIDNETYERLHVHALRRRMTLSELVIDLAKTHLREYFISRNGGTRTEPAE